MVLYLCHRIPKNTFPQPNHEKNIRQIPLGGHSTKYVTSTPQNCGGHQKQGKSAITARCNVSWMGSWNR